MPSLEIITEKREGTRRSVIGSIGGSRAVKRNEWYLDASKNVEIRKITRDNRSDAMIMIGCNTCSRSIAGRKCWAVDSI